MPDMEFDSIRCEGHNKDVATVRERQHTLANSIMVDKSELREALKDLESEVKLLRERIPDNLKERFSQVSGRLDNLHSDFTLLRTQVYWIIGLFVSAGVLAFMSFVLKGGLK